MKSSILRTVAAGVTLAILIFFMPFLLAGAMITLLFGFIVLRLFFFRRMRREFAGRTRFRNVDPMRSPKYRSGHEDGNQVIYLSPDQYR